MASPSHSSSCYDIASPPQRKQHCVKKLCLRSHFNMKPTSSLTRSVFRAIITNRPYVVAECKRRPFHHKSHPRVYNHPSHVQRRTIFGFLTGSSTTRGFDGAKSTPKNVELALGKLVDLLRARRTRSRPPSDEEVLDAFKFVFFARLESHKRLTRNEIYITTETFKYLNEKGLMFGEDKATALSKQDLDVILSSLAVPYENERFRSDAKSLASMVFQSLQETNHDVSNELLPTYIMVLANTGSAIEALRLLQDPETGSSEISKAIWIEVLNGLAAERRDKEFWATLKGFQKLAGPLDPLSHEQLMRHLAEADRIWDTERMLSVPLTPGTYPTTECLRHVLELCIRTGKWNWGSSIAKDLQQRPKDSNAIGCLIMWYATQDSNLQSFRQRVHDLLLDNRVEVTMSTFNRVIEYGLKKNNPALATTLIEMAEAVGLNPDSKTYAIQLQSALDDRNLPTAAKFYESMLTEDVPSDNSDIPVLNNYVARLAFDREPDYDQLMRVVDGLLERDADLDAEAVAGLCRVFLGRDELDDATGLLRHRVDSYPAPDRARISAIFQSFIADPSIQEQRAFNAYELFRHAFPETPVVQRLPLMQSFFDRKRPDLACLVFGHMRQREDPEDPARPTPAAYAQCFEGIAQCRDIDGLQMVYNMLKLDLEVEMTTRIRNGLMLAYIACQMPFTAIIDHFWKIMDSREGPSYSSFEVALRACETWVPYGSFEARKIVAIMQSYNLEITKECYDCYVGAIAGQSEFENAVALIEAMKESIGEFPDAYTIGTFYNAIPWQYRKDEVEKWAKKTYPDLWKEVLTFGEEIDEEWEVRYFKLDRSIDIDDPPLFPQHEYRPELSRQTQVMLEPLLKPSEKKENEKVKTV